MTKLFKWAKPYKLIIFLILLLTVLAPLTYSYIPQFIKYVVDIIFKGDPDSKVTLPKVVVDFFASFQEPLTAVLWVAIFLVIY